MVVEIDGSLLEGGGQVSGCKKKDIVKMTRVSFFLNARFAFFSYKY